MKNSGKIKINSEDFILGKLIEEVKYDEKLKYDAAVNYYALLVKKNNQKLS